MACLGLALSVASLESIGKLYVDHQHQSRLASIRAERARLLEYRRTSIVGEPADQNAAIWYSLALGRVRSVPVAVRREIGRFAAENDHFLPEADPLIQHECREVRDDRFREALRSTRCNWIDTTASDAIDASIPSQALFLGNCLIASGRSSAAHGDLLSAARSYRWTLTFAQDLGQGDYSMNLVGLALSELTFRALGSLIAAADDNVKFLRTLEEESTGWQEAPPTFENGLRLARLDLARNIEIAAREHSTRSHALQGLFLYRHRRMLNLMEELVHAHGVAAQTLADAVEHEAGLASDQTIRDVVPEHLRRTMDSAGFVRRLAFSVQGAIRLHRWHAMHEEFPPDETLVSWSFGREGLKYELLDMGRSYRIIIVNGWKSGETLIRNGVVPVR